MGERSCNFHNPMQTNKCGAHCRTTNQPCKNSAMPNGKCRMHGGKSTGRPILNGLYTKSAKLQREEIRDIINTLKELV